MNIEVQPGTYVIAVSGGVDSVALLHRLSQLPDMQLVVAHYDHGIREDSIEDRKHVQQLARQLGLPFVYDEGNLGKNASEAAARQARYGFLRSVQRQSRAHAIITAHHQDDVIETAILNLVRGTGRKGMSSLKSTDGIVRPLLHMPKEELIAYAKLHQLQWREDSTNTDTKYKRNYVRHKIVPKLTPGQRDEFVTYITNLHDLNHKIDTHINNQLHVQPATNKLKRTHFVLLPHDVAKELFATWLRIHGIRDFDAKGLERMVVAAKTYAPNQLIDINNTHQIAVYKGYLALEPRDR
jgi:tRNA(Ile)-lysidine synthetase-like protein